MLATRLATRAVWITGFAALAGCRIYRLVEVRDGSFTYSVDDDDRRVPEALRREANLRCASGAARVTHEGLVRVGAPTPPDLSIGRQGPELLGHEPMDVPQTTEWHVTFACVEAAHAATPVTVPTSSTAPVVLPD